MRRITSNLSHVIKLAIFTIRMVLTANSGSSKHWNYTLLQAPHCQHFLRIIQLSSTTHLLHKGTLWETFQDLGLNFNQTEMKLDYASVCDFCFIICGNTGWRARWWQNQINHLPIWLYFSYFFHHITCISYHDTCIIATFQKSLSPHWLFSLFQLG